MMKRKLGWRLLTISIGSQVVEDRKEKLIIQAQDFEENQEVCFAHNNCGCSHGCLAW